MDWSKELADSARWLAVAFTAVLLGIAALAPALIRCTHWGKQVRDLAWPYFTPRRSWRPLAGAALMILLTLFSVRMSVLFSFWYNGFYSAMQKLDSKQVWFLIGLFGLLATIHVARALLNYYVQQAFEIHWRIWLNAHFTQRWLQQQAYFRSQYLVRPVDNPDQRIQQDVASFVSTSISLSMGLVSALVSIVAFTAILWTLSGPLAVFGVVLPRAMVFIVFAYVFIATVLAFRLGRPLIGLAFLGERFNASYRYSLIRLKEYGESIAFYRGEAVEARVLASHFSDIIGNAWRMIFRTLKLSGFNLAVGQAAVVFPFIVQLPRFLQKQIALGDVMQTVSAFGQVQDALSFFRESYDTFAAYRASLDRLTGFMDAAREADALPTPEIRPEGSRVALVGATVRRPDGTILVAGLDVDIAACQPLLIRGASGTGKTTLLRAMAGLWPFADGRITLPADALFLPQKPYLPTGTLRNAIYYPLPAADDARADNVLSRCHLGHLAAYLDTVDDWTRRLSLGEQQRLAFGRILINMPKVVFLDEATSAMDEPLESALYTLLTTALPGLMIVSVGHRSTLRAFHLTELVLQGEGKWMLAPIPDTERVHPAPLITPDSVPA